jgi:ATP-binding cassette, subfamily B, multidrug efflux pump
VIILSELIRTAKYLKPYKKGAVLAIFFLALVVAAELAIPRLVQTIIDEGVAKQNMAVITQMSLLMVGVSLLAALFMTANTVFAIRSSRGFEADLRETTYEKIQSFSFGNLDEFTTGQLLTRLTSDLNQVRMVVTLSLRMFTRMPLTFLGSIAIMLATNLRLSLIMAVLLPVTLVFSYFFIKLLQPLFTKVQERLDRLNQVMQENLLGIRVVKAFVRRDYENKRFEKANDELYENSLRVAQLLSLFNPLTVALLNLGIVGVLYYGGLQIQVGFATVGEIVAFTNYLNSAMFSVLTLSLMAGNVASANVSAGRILKVIDSEPKISAEPNAKRLDSLSGRVSFEGVSFSYGNGGTLVIHDITFEAMPGERVAILGATGSGKTTLVNLIPRFYDATFGKVTVDGVDVKELDLKSMRSGIGICMQDTMLFSGSIRDNVLFGRKDASDEEVVEAAKAAQAHGFISGFPEGYDTLVGQRGVTLSGGQKQRIAIARALLVKPKILILDDSTSSVDAETEYEIEKALDKTLAGSTRFIVAQRISTVLHADKIIVLDEGAMVAMGTHRQLLASSPIYREIYESQLGDGGAVL